MKDSIIPILLALVMLFGTGAFFFFKHQKKIEKKLQEEKIKKEKEKKEKKDALPSKKSNSNKTKEPKEKATPKSSQTSKKEKTYFVDMKKKRIRIKGYVTIRQGLIEVFACTPRGKRHESIFTLLCDPKILQFHLLAFGLKPSPQVKYFGEGGKLKGDKVYIYAFWKDPKTKKDVVYRGEDLVFNIRTKKTMKRTGWVFTGSRFQKYKYKTEDGKTHEREIFMAAYAGNLVVTYHDPDAILNNPMETGGDDTIYYSNYLALPPRGHPVELVFTTKPVPEWDKKSKPYDASKVKKKVKHKKK